MCCSANFYTIFGLIFLFHLGNSQFPSPNVTTPKRTIRVGIAAAQTTQSGSIGWSSCGGAVPIAVQYLQQKGMLKDFDFEYIMEYTECDKASAVKAGLKFMKDLKVDVVIGPPCAKALEVMGTLSVIYQKLVLAWGFVSESQLADTSRFPYVTSVQPTAQTLGQATAKVLEQFKWDRIALLYYSDEQNYCQSVVDDVEATLNDPDSFPVNIVWKGQLEYTNAAATRYTLNAVKSRARIILFCAISGPEKRDYLIKIAQENMTSNDYVHVLLTMRSIGYGVQSAVGKKPLILFCAISGPEKRDYIIKIAQENMTSNEYVHVLLTMRSIGYGVQTSVGKKTFKNGLTPLWESFSVNPDGNESMAKKAAEKMLVIDINSDVQDAEFLQYFTKNAADAVRNPPMNCNSSACVNASSASMGSYARHLFDVFYLYGQAVDKLNTTDPNIYNDLNYLVPQLMTSFDGMTGRVQISKSLYRVPFYQLYGLDADYEQIPLINMTFFNASSTMSLGYSDENKSVWHFWGNQRPLDTPICGFSGRNCPIKFWDQYGVLIFVAGIVILFLVLIIIICAGWIVRNRKLEQQRQNSEWQIPSIKLQIPEKRKTENSKRSINSGPSTVTGDSKMTGEGLYGFHENYTVLIYEKDLVLTTRHHGISLNSMEKEKYAKLRKLDHDNLNKFIGLSIDGPLWISVWKMCSRGSLQDIITRGNFSMDGFFMFCIIRDIAEGLNFLHKSFLRLHGNLRSATCLVNDSWQVKLAEFGMDDLLEEHTPTKRRLLWAAPEVLRGSLTVSQMDPSADVYSFAIVASEILTKKEAWDFANRKEGADEILYMIKKGGARAIRPELIPDAEVSPSLCTLVKDCWSEVPEDRPKSEQICKLLFEMTPKANTNLMDHVFNMLEEYTTTLEVDIEERTKELTLEKKKADILLSRMLPKQVAERLKAGQTVEPEGFDSVTVFFSDVVKFTQLSQKCSPFQVVNLLNDLYSNFDTIIEEHGVYKVESIGDGYLCVSGLPTRNGYAHIKQIVDMSLQFMEYCRKFKIPHLPREQVELRIGVNSGPCVAGVVGLSMPRYCLFGDTVNTASRMESNGKPSQIHMSEAAHSLLTSHYPHQYETSSRGEVIIKGKGVMETFWVHGKSQDMASMSTRTTPPVTDENWPPHFKDEQLKRAKTPYPERVFSASHKNNDTLKVQY